MQTKKFLPKFFKPLIAIVLLSAIGTIGLAQISDKLFELALSRSASVQSAKSDLSEATAKLERTKADPLAIKPELLAAQISVDAAGANFIASRLDLRKNLTRDYFAWTENQDALDLAKLKQQLSQLNLTAAQVRFKAGAINAVELSRAESEARSSSIDLDGSQTDLDGAATNLKTRLGELPKIGETMPATPKPTRAALEASLENNPRFVNAQAQLERSKLDVLIKDNEFTPQAEIDSAKIALENAKRSLDDTRTSFRSNLGTAWDAYQTALAAIPARERNTNVSQDELKAQEARLAKGLASKLNVLQSRVALEQSQFVLSQSRRRAALAVLDLAGLANLDLWKKN